MSDKTPYNTNNAFSQPLRTPSHQLTSLPKGYRHETIRVSSNTTPTWGGNVVFRITQKNISIDRIVLEFGMSAISGLTVSAGNAAYVPTHLWAQRIEIVQGSTVMETIPAKFNFLVHQLLVPSSEEKRTLQNLAAGNYGSHSVRATKSATADVWYLPLVGVWSQTSYPLITEGDIEIRVQFANLSDSFSLQTNATATGTPISTFNSATALVFASHTPQSVINYTKALMRKSPLHFGFQNVVAAPSFTIASGQSSANLTLSSITGYVSCFFFVVRGSNPTNAAQLAYNQTMTSFEILSAGSTNVVGGMVISDLQNRLIQCGNWLDSTFTSEVGGIYFYSFSIEPRETWKSNASLGGYMFTGSEILRVNFSSALGAAAQVDMYALTYNAIEMGLNGVRVIGLSE